MGHLTRIANTVVQNLEKGQVQSQINDLIKGKFVRMCNHKLQFCCRLKELSVEIPLSTC